MPLPPKTNEHISSALVAVYSELMLQLIKEGYPPAVLVADHQKNMSTQNKQGFFATIHHNEYPPNNLGGKLKARYIALVLTNPETPRE